MNSRGVLTISAAANLALLAACLLLQRPSDAPASATILPSPDVFVESVSSPAPKTRATNAPPPAWRWSLIESEDYHQYLANLRDIGCPERLIRDIIVADLDDLYARKLHQPAAPLPPWTGASRRRAEARTRATKLHGLKTEKRKLVKELIGYEWDSHAGEIWNQDYATSLLLGFLPDIKAAQVLSLVAKFTEAAAHIREDANYVLMGEDQARLRSLYENYQIELTQLLGPLDTQEYQLRMQAVRFFPLHDLQFDGLEVSSAELRELARLSQTVKDQNLDAFVDEAPAAEAETARRWKAFEAQIHKLLGPERLADFQRAQDARFRDSHTFTKENDLPVTAAIALYETRSEAEETAEALKTDAALPAEARAALLELLKQSTSAKLAATLGTNQNHYLESAGQWVNNLTAPPDPNPEAAP